MKFSYLLLFVFIALTVSCASKSTLLTDNVTTVPVDNAKVFKNKKLFTPSVLINIDTTSLYEEIYSYKSTTEKSYERADAVNWESDKRWTKYYKFYSNGNVNSFYFPYGETVTTESLNPNYKGSRGIQFLKDGKHTIQVYARTGYGFTPTYGLYTYYAKVENDTLYLKSTRSLNSVYVYVKRKLPEGYTEYKTDW